MKLHLSALLILIYFHTSAQVRYYKNYPNLTTQNYPVTERTPDGGFVVSGSDAWWYSSQAHVIKYNSCGETEWTRVLQSLIIADMILTKDNHILIFSMSNSLIKMDLAGNIVWTKNYSNGGSAYYGYSVGEFPNGDLFINGNVSMYNNAPSKSYIIKLDAAGNIKWNYEYGSFSSWGMATACSDGGVLSRAYFMSFKTDSSGNLQWSKEFHKTGQSFEPLEVNDGFIFARFSDTGNSDTCFLYKTNKQGHLLWTSKRFNLNFATRLRKLANGNIMVIGSLIMIPGSYRFIPSIVEISPAGNIISQKCYRPVSSFGNSFHGDGFCFLNDSSMVITGRDRYAGTNASVLYTLKTGKQGKSSCIDSIVTQVYPSIPVNTVNVALNKTSANFTMYPSSISILNNSPMEETSCAGYDTIEFDFPHSLCVPAGGTIQLQAPVGYEYLWSTGDTVNSITVNSAGYYSVQLKHPCHNAVLTVTTQVHFCLSVGINENMSGEQIQVFPNPAKENFSLYNFSGTMIMYSNVGKKIMEKDISSGELIAIENLPRGIYFLNLRNKYTVATRKLVIQ